MHFDFQNCIALEMIGPKLINSILHFIKAVREVILAFHCVYSCIRAKIKIRVLLQDMSKVTMIVFVLKSTVRVAKVMGDNCYHSNSWGCRSNGWGWLPKQWLGLPKKQFRYYCNS